MLAEDLAKAPDDSAVFHHPLVETLEEGTQIDHILRPDVHQLVIESSGLPKEVVVNVIELEHMQLIQHRVGIRAAVEHPFDNLSVGSNGGEFIYQVLGCHNYLCLPARGHVPTPTVAQNPII